MSPHEDADTAAGSAPYFFLSYAHSAPLEGAEPEPTDSWVAAVFEDLSEAVRAAARLERQRPVGFFDGLLNANDSWKTRVTWELGGANVFVPLCSPKYFSMTVPGREWACFSSRLLDDSPEDLRAHVVPVLWAPMAGAEGPRDLPEPLGLVPDVPEYAENGLRALKALKLSEQYERVVARLAERIVETARSRPLARSAPLPIDRLASAFQSKGVEDDFVIAVAAPTAGTAPAGRTAAWYGESSTDWRPFGGPGGDPLAEYTLSVAERNGFNTSVVSVQRAAAADAPPTPGIVLIDPWIAAAASQGGAGGEGGESEPLLGLRRLFDRPQPPEWMLPVLVLNGRDAESTACQDTLVRRIARILEEVRAPSAGASAEDDVVTDIDSFAKRMPGLVAEAERRYLRYGPDSPNDHSGEGRPAPGDCPPLDSDGWE